MTLMKPRELKNYLLNEKKKYLIKSLKTQKLQWIYGQRLLWQKLLMQRTLSMSALKSLVSLSLIKTFLQLTLVILLRWLLKLERLIKREPRSSIRSSSIRTVGGFTQRFTRCDPTKEEQ